MPILKEEQSSDPINQRVFLLLLLKDRRWGVCVPELWKEQAQLEEQRGGKGGLVGGNLDLPQTCLGKGQLPMAKAFGRGVIQRLPKGWWGRSLVRAGLASVEWPHPLLRL